jgi:hypothetical protein
MGPNAQQLPSFASLDELVEFFDSHDVGEYEETLPEAYFGDLEGQRSMPDGALEVRVLVLAP